MLQTFFEFQGKKFRIKYQKIHNEDGILYQGMILTKNIIGFAYLKTDDNGILFDNDFLDKQYRDLIVQVIERKEKAEKKR